MPAGSGAAGRSRPPAGTILDATHAKRLLEASSKGSGQVGTAEVFLVDAIRAVAHQESAKMGICDIPIERITLQAPYSYLEEPGLTGS